MNDTTFIPLFMGFKIFIYAFFLSVCWGWERVYKEGSTDITSDLEDLDVSPSSHPFLLFP